MSFAETQLKKYGWTRGQGLGKNSNGIKNPIIISNKKNTRGLGLTEDWSFEWWTQVYNKSLDNIEVSKSLDGEIRMTKTIKNPEIPRNKMGIISTVESHYSNINNEKKPHSNFLYNNFVKVK
nr:7092_t:CDS:2 [Entrophospora candida]CAG8604129.1 260_t:CDS:2 [Entrophospora candida]